MNGSQTSPQTSNLHVGFGLAPGNPFWVQVREAVQQHGGRAQPHPGAHCRANCADQRQHSTALSGKLKAQELGALISHVVPESLMLAILNEGLPIVCSEDTTLVHPLFVSVHGLDQPHAGCRIMCHRTGGGQLLMVGEVEAAAKPRSFAFRAFARQWHAIRQFAASLSGRPGGMRRRSRRLARRSQQVAGGFPAGRIEHNLWPLRPVGPGGPGCQPEDWGSLDSKTIVVGINGDRLGPCRHAEAGTVRATSIPVPGTLGSKLAEFSQRAARQ